MKYFAKSLLLLALFGTITYSDPPTPLKAKYKPKFTIAKDTIVIDGPRDMDGFIDYAAALNEQLCNGVTPDNNANVLLWQAMGPRPGGSKGMSKSFYKWMMIEEPRSSGDYFVDLLPYLKIDRKVDGDKKVEEIEAELSRCSQNSWKVSDHPRIAEWLKANEKPLALVVQASRRSHYFSPQEAVENGKYHGLLAARIPGVLECRAIGRALTTQEMLDIGAGRTTDAWQRLLACHRLSRLLTKSSAMIEMLVGYSLNSLASKAALAFLENAKLSSAQIKDCIRDLQVLPAMSPVVNVIDVGERFMYLDTVMMINRWGIVYLEELHPVGPGENPRADLKQISEAIDWDPALMSGNRWFDRMVAAMRQKDPVARRKALDQIDKDFEKLKKDVVDLKFIDPEKLSTTPEKLINKYYGDLVVGARLPRASRIQSAFDQIEQTLANLKLAFALAAYRGEHGHYPEKLELLAPKLLTEMPADIFSGKTLHYHRTETGFLLYSVGPNGQDDHGRGLDDNPKGDDLAVRMPSLKKR